MVLNSFRPGLLFNSIACLGLVLEIVLQERLEPHLANKKVKEWKP